MPMEDHQYESDTAGCSLFLSQQDGDTFTAEALYMEVGSQDVVVGASNVVGPTVTSSSIDIDETPQKKTHHRGKMNRDEYISDKRRRQKSLSKNLKTFLAKGEALHKTCGVAIYIKVTKENGDVLEQAFPPKQTRNVKTQAGGIPTMATRPPVQGSPQRRRSLLVKKSTKKVQGLPGKKPQKSPPALRRSNKCRFCNIIHGSAKDKIFMKKHSFRATWIGCDATPECDFWSHANCSGIEIKSRKELATLNMRPFYCDNHK